MFYLAAAVTFVGALCLFDLVLSLGIIRRLREQNATLERLATGAGGETQGLTTVRVGDVVGEFAATTTAGRAVERDAGSAGQRRERLVAFLSPGCGPCEEQLPALIDYAASNQREVLAVVAAGVAAKPETYVSRLAPVADVVIEPAEGPIGQAFKVLSSRLGAYLPLESAPPPAGERVAGRAVDTEELAAAGRCRPAGATSTGERHLRAAAKLLDVGAELACLVLAEHRGLALDLSRLAGRGHPAGLHLELHRGGADPDQARPSAFHTLGVVAVAADAARLVERLALLRRRRSAERSPGAAGEISV